MVKTRNMSNMITVELPMNEITAAFLDMNEENRLRAIELGTIFLAKGGDTVQAWTSAEWDRKMTDVRREHDTLVYEWKMKSLSLLTKNEDLQKDISSVTQSQNDAIRRAVETSKTQYESVIQRLSTDMEAMRAQG